MEERLFPTALEELDAWRRRHGAPAEEARRRFVQFVILESIAAAPGLAGAIVFKGGNALRFIYGGRRSTLDLDFTAVGTFPDDDSEIRRRLDDALRLAPSRYRIKARCQRVRRNPPGKDKTRPTYAISVGYAFPTDRLYRDFDGVNSLPSVVDVEISLNEVLCEVLPRRLHPGGKELAVCSLEDIVAEKLRALLQQPIRNRSRPQDVLDIANVVRRLGHGLDAAKVARFLIEKSGPREVDPRKSKFDEEVRSRARVDYDQLGGDTPEFIPFEEAWAEVLTLVSTLSIPD